MTTLISVYNSQGCVGRCDARCYNAKTADCDCICGGANHGVGEARATDNVINMSKERLKEIEAKGGWIPDALKQGSLF